MPPRRRFAVYVKGGKQKRMDALMDDPRSLLMQIGMLTVEASNRAFILQRLGNAKWQARMNPNVPGIISDFTLGRPAPLPRRFHSRNTLRDTGALMRSVTYRLVSSKIVEVGSNLPYAKALHSGGESETEEITKQVRFRLWQWLKKQGKEMKEALGWLLNKKYIGTRLTINHPPRPIVGLTTDLRKTIKEAIGVTVAQV